MEKEKFPKAFETSVNICFVSDEKYAEPLCTALYSLLWNRDKTRLYDILILKMTFLKKRRKRFGHWQMEKRG